MKIGFDVDGVLYPFEDCFREWMRGIDPENARLGTFDPPATQWSFFEDWGMGLDEFKREMAGATLAGHLYTSQGPYSGAMEILGWCRSHGHSVHLVTHRAEHGAVGNTEAWLENHKVPFTTLTFAHDKSIIDADVLIEDRPENLDVWLRTGKPGIIFTRAWNEDWDHVAAGAIRVGSYEQLRHVLQNLVNVAALRKAATPTQVVETVLQEAQRLIYGDRNADYGHPAEDLTRTGRIWGAILGTDDVPPWKVALCMVGVKISREVNGRKRDNLTDMAGYAGVAEMVYERFER